MDFSAVDRWFLGVAEGGGTKGVYHAILAHRLSVAKVPS